MFGRRRIASSSTANRAPHAPCARRPGWLRRAWGAGAEAGGVYLLIIGYIWWARPHSRAWILAPVAVVAASHLARRETPTALGFRLTNFARGLRAIGPGLLACVLGLLALGAALGGARDVTPTRFLVVLATYAPWGLFQQYALNGYFANRFIAAVRDPRLAALLAAVCFAGAHVPNWFLVSATLVGGYLSARAYLAYRNLLLLGLIHALLGTLLVLTVPRSITHGLRTGPGEWRAQRTPVARNLAK